MDGRRAPIGHLAGCIWTCDDTCHCARAQILQKRPNNFWMAIWSGTFFPFCDDEPEQYAKADRELVEECKKRGIEDVETCDFWTAEPANS